MTSVDSLYWLDNNQNSNNDSDQVRGLIVIHWLIYIYLYCCCCCREQ